MNDLYTLIPNLAEMAPDVPADSILSRTFYKDERLSAVLFSFAPGEELSEHTSAYPALLHFLSGRAQLTLGADGPMMVEAGAWVRMSPKLPHSVVAETPVVMLLLMLR
ncbi:cupin domain-containing protein [Promineifilum sp.]|uniref:cupin domain-containing protein n=1 Tax=Promineifilum sp. TaxID=2664178 RepID=UPI0035AEC882